jgi:hypothetical protein
MRSIAQLLIMGFFGTLFGCSDVSGDVPQRYVTEASFRKNLATQSTMSPQTVAELRKHGVTEDSSLKLEFFFYTDKEIKGQGLAAALRSLNYNVESGPSAGDPKLILVTGWTIPIKMSDGEVVGWTEKMCRLGYEHDCKFDGWGTNPEQ